MGWARFDDKRADNEKLMRAGFEARGLDEAAICWCAGHETDGVIPERAVAMLAAGHGCGNWRRVVAKLVDVDRWHPTGDGWQIHDYLVYNPSRKEIEAKREDERTRKASQRKKGAGTSGRATNGQFNPTNVPLGQPPGQPPGQTQGQPPGRDIESTATRPVPSQSPSNPPHATSTDAAADPPKTEGMKSNLRPHLQPLVERWVSICDPKSQLRVRNDAPPVIAHLLGYLDAGVIDECIGICAERSTSPPKSAKYLLQTCREFAARNLPGMLIPDLTATATA
jgi:hypothetical protein